MTQIQNMNPMPGALGGLGANNPAYTGRKDGASTDFSRLLNQSNQQLQDQSAQSAKTTMAKLQSQQLASQQMQSQQQSRQLEAQQQAQRQESAQPPKPMSPPPRTPENTAAKDENKLAARNAAARNSASKAEDAKTPTRATKSDPATAGEATDVADAADASDPADTARTDAASGKDAERVVAKDDEGKDKKAAKDAKDTGATAAEQILAMLRGDAPVETRAQPRAGTAEGDEAGTDALPGGANAQGKQQTTGDVLRERQQLQRELSQAAAGTASAVEGADKSAQTDALHAASSGAHEISMGDAAAKGPQPSFEALLAAAQQTGAASSTSGADATSATQAPSVPLSHPLDSPDFAPELSASVSLLIQDGVHEAQLQLNPTEMGPVSINIQLDGQQAQVNFHAQHAATREVLERSLPDLAAALQAQGLTLSGGGVFAQSQSSGGQNRGDGSADGTSNGHGRRSGRGQGSDDDGAIAATGRSERRSAPRGLVDLYA
ncbi:flagellar hook-length control protein FliK [Roseateles chitinivorans]|uniref:flagellar hook-length control protein FliK n=1 Tax=Roseateles chitinivorans TaxID=2917965 RepID=UPI003D666610